MSAGADRGQAAPRVGGDRRVAEAGGRISRVGLRRKAGGGRREARGAKPQPPSLSRGGPGWGWGSFGGPHPPPNLPLEGGGILHRGRRMHLTFTPHISCLPHRCAPLASGLQLYVSRLTLSPQPKIHPTPFALLIALRIELGREQIHA